AENRVRAKQTTTPLNTNGTETRRHVPTTDAIPESVTDGSTGISSCAVKHTAIDTANKSEKSQSRCLTCPSGKRSGLRCTSSAPTVIPNSASEIAPKAKWYHIVTLKMRVKMISYISVASVTMNRPP